VPSARPPFGAEWKYRTPDQSVTSISSLRAPGYLIPAEVYPKVRWSRSLRGWGGSEAAVSLKAFIAGVDILHLCGPVAYHQFKKKFHYDVSWDEVWRNHAIIARICFDERTWYEYWLPEVFEKNLSAAALNDLESDELRIEHEE